MVWDGRRAPFTLLGGYLGAGKTTIVNRILAQAAGRRITVLVNDVGAVNVDAALIAEHEGDTLTLTNGCVCCAIADDFGQTLEMVRSGPRPDHVLMELSGVGEPARIAPWASTAGFVLDGIVVAADADQIVQLADRRFVGDTIRAQLRDADVVVLTKTDLVADAGRAARRFVGTVSGAPVVDVVDGAVDLDIVLGVDRSARASWVQAATAVEHGHEPRLLDLGDVTVDTLRAAVDALPAGIVRAKGLIRCVDSDAPHEVHVVGSRRTVEPRGDLAAELAGTQLVVIDVA